jgi:hypothetical protein
VKRIVKISYLQSTASGLPEGANWLSLEDDGRSARTDLPRFSLLVESSDPRIGIFAASFAAHLLSNFALSLPGEDDRDILTQVAALIHDYPETQREIARLTGDLNESVANINSAIQELAQTNLADPWHNR